MALLAEGAVAIAATNWRKVSSTNRSTRPSGSKLHQSNEPCHCEAMQQADVRAAHAAGRAKHSSSARVSDRLPGGPARPKDGIAKILAQDQQPIRIGFDPAIVFREHAVRRATAPSAVFGTFGRELGGLLVQPVPG